MRAIGGVALSFLLGAAPIVAPPDWTQVPRTEVTLSNFKFAPQIVQLRAGQPVVLHIVNTASGRHNFAAKAFFDAATIRPADAAIIDHGTIEIGGHQSVDIGLVPITGQYPLKCTHAFHKMFGMTGTIVVG